MNINGYEVTHIIDRENNIPKVYGNPSMLHLGQNLGLNNTIFNCSAEIWVEDDVFFGHNVLVLTGIHDYSRQGGRRKDDVSLSRPVRIKSGAWIASGAIICPGVTIGAHAVIGAGSVVRSDIPACQLWAGNPARFIKPL